MLQPVHLQSGARGLGMCTTAAPPEHAACCAYACTSHSLAALRRFAVAPGAGEHADGGGGLDGQAGSPGMLQRLADDMAAKSLLAEDSLPVGETESVQVLRITSAGRLFRWASAGVWMLGAATATRTGMLAAPCSPGQPLDCSSALPCSTIRALLLIDSCAVLVVSWHLCYQVVVVVVLTPDTCGSGYPGGGAVGSAASVCAGV